MNNQIFEFTAPSPPLRLKQDYESIHQKLYSPADSAIAFIDFQPQMLFGVANADRATLINNGRLSSPEQPRSSTFTGNIVLGSRVVQRLRLAAIADDAPGNVPWSSAASRRSWDCQGFRKTIEATGHRNILMTGRWMRFASPG